MNYKNMKIEINESQPLDDVVRELGRIGGKYMIVANLFDGVGVVFISQLDDLNCTYSDPVANINLTELKAMTND